MNIYARKQDNPPPYRRNLSQFPVHKFQQNLQENWQESEEQGGAIGTGDSSGEFVTLKVGHEYYSRWNCRFLTEGQGILTKRA